jgi:nitrogen regulatory protein PII
VKLITAIIKPMQLHAVYEALEGIGITGLTSAEVQRIMPHGEHSDSHNCADEAMFVRTKLRIEVAVSDDQLGAAVAVITEAAHTGSTGDGSLFVTPLDQAVSLHTRRSYTEAPGAHRVEVTTLVVPAPPHKHSAAGH